MVSACYLAMTAAEFASCRVFPAKCAWMACQFSPSGGGLSNLPRILPSDAMVILSDQAPMAGHDPDVIRSELERIIRRFSCAGVLLDFQRPEAAQTRALAEYLVRLLPCPVGVSEPYAGSLDAPVFLPPVPLRVPVEKYLAGWRGREVWLDIAPDGEEITVTEEGIQAAPIPRPEFDAACQDEALCCHYRTDVSDRSVHFSLRRTSGDLERLIARAQENGVTKLFGLWQELRQ